MLNSKLTLSNVSNILKVSPITISRLSKTDSDFPEVSKIGRSLFIDSDSLYSWLSLKAGQEVKPEDQLLTGKDLQSIFNKSHTWIWQNVKSGVLPKPFKINRSTYWLESQIKRLDQKDAA